MIEKQKIKKVIDTCVSYAQVLIIMIISYTITFIVFDSTYILFIFTASISSLIVVMILDICRQLRRLIDNERATGGDQERS